MRGADSFVPKPLQLGIVWAIWQFCLLKAPRDFQARLGGEVILKAPRGGMALPREVALGPQTMLGDIKRLGCDESLSAIELPNDILTQPLPRMDGDEEPSVCQQQ